MNDRRTLWPKWGRHEAFDNMFENTLGQLAPPAYMQSVEVVSFFFYFFLKSKFNNFFILKIGAFFCSAVALECLATMKRTKMKRKNVKKKKQPLHWYFFWYRFSMLFFLKKKEICFNSNYLKNWLLLGWATSCWTCCRTWSSWRFLHCQASSHVHWRVEWTRKVLRRWSRWKENSRFSIILFFFMIV